MDHFEVEDCHDSKRALSVLGCKTLMLEVASETPGLAEVASGQGWPVSQTIGGPTHKDALKNVA